jgi:YtkA-like
LRKGCKKVPDTQSSGPSKRLRASYEPRIAAEMVLFLLCFILVFPAGCSRNYGSKAATPMPWVSNLTAVPSPPVEGKATTFHVSLKDQSGQPVTGARVRVSLAMPSMDMGKNEIPLDDQGNGDYIGTGSFTMAGPWNVLLHAEKDQKQGDQKYEMVVQKQG